MLRRFDFRSGKQAPEVAAERVGDLWEARRIVADEPELEAPRLALHELVLRNSRVLLDHVPDETRVNHDAAVEVDDVLDPPLELREEREGAPAGALPRGHPGDVAEP